MRMDTASSQPIQVHLKDILQSNSTSFFLKYITTFSGVPDPATPGNCSISHLTSNPITTGQSVTVDLYCGPTDTFAQTFNNVIIGELYESTLDLTVLFGNCTLKYSGSDSYNATETAVTVVGLIEITSPVLGSSVASNSTIDVTWISKPPPTQFRTFNVTLDCKSDGSVSLRLSQVNLQVNYYSWNILRW